MGFNVPRWTTRCMTEFTDPSDMDSAVTECFGKNPVE